MKDHAQATYRVSKQRPALSPSSLAPRAQPRRPHAAAAGARPPHALRFQPTETNAERCRARAQALSPWPWVSGTFTSGRRRSLLKECGEIRRRTLVGSGAVRIDGAFHLLQPRRRSGWPSMSCGPVAPPGPAAAGAGCTLMIPRG